MLDLVERMKVGKATAGFVKYEHILLGSPKLLVHLHILFNGLIQHGYVPHDFLSGVVTPIVKDAEGDVSSTSNYRGITLSVVFASLFEMAILTRIGHLLTTDNLQFGYKKRHSCSHAVFVLRSCIEYFTTHSSNVFATFLDCSKGFYKINHLVVRQRIWVRSAMGNERMLLHNAIQSFMNDQKEALDQRFCS